MVIEYLKGELFDYIVKTGKVSHLMFRTMGTERHDAHSLRF